MRRRCNHNLSERVEQSAARLHTEHRRPAHAIRCAADYCSSRRNICETLASCSSPGDERYLPRGRPSILFPDIGMNPASIDVTPPAESERELSSATDAVSRETSPAQARARVHTRFGGRSPAACCCPPYGPAMLGAIATPCTQVTDPAALRTAGSPIFTLPGGSRCLPRGRGW